MAYLLSPQTPEGEVRTWLEKLSALVGSAEGSIREMPDPKRHILSYPVKHHKQAFFGWLIFTGPSTAPEKIREGMKHDQVLLRMLIIEEQRETKPRVAIQPQTPKPPSPPEEQSAPPGEIDKKIDEAVAATESIQS